MKCSCGNICYYKTGFDWTGNNGYCREAAGICKETSKNNFYCRDEEYDKLGYVTDDPDS